MPRRVRFMYAVWAATGLVLLAAHLQVRLKSSGAPVASTAAVTRLATAAR